MRSLRDRLARLEDHVRSPPDATCLLWWNELTATILAVPTGGTLPAHLERPEQRDVAMATLFAERGFDLVRMSGEAFCQVCVEILDDVAAEKAKSAGETRA